MKIKADGESISAETYRVFRANILSGKITPGARVTTMELCKTFDASLGAVREALSRLRAEGLISAEAHRGYMVTPISIEDLRDLTQIRIDIETMCLARSIEHGGLEWEANLLASAHLLAKSHKGAGAESFPSLRFQETHQGFHYALVSACGSPRLLKTRQQLFDESERYRHLNVAVAPERNAAKEHRQIVEATLARDNKRAQQLLAEHIGRTTEGIVKAMTRHTAPQPASRRKTSSRK